MPTAWRASIVELLPVAGAPRRDGRARPRRVLAHYDIDRLVDDIAALYRELLARTVGYRR